MLVDKALKKDLIRSSLPTSLIKKLGLYVVKGEQLKRELRYRPATKLPAGLKAYAIPYFDEHGKDTGFRRYRMLSTNTSWYEMFSSSERAKFGKGTKELRAAKAYKYNQPAGTEPHLYIPPNIVWPITSAKIKVPYLLITEGEKKSIKAAQCGIHCVAIPGVWNFKSKKRRMSLLPEFRRFDFTDTRVEVCFDTDAEFNENIRDALFTITGELEHRIHRPVRHVKLPSTGERTALDDYLGSFATEQKARDSFFSLEREGDVDKEDALRVLNESVVFVRSQSKFYSIPDNTYFGRNALMDEYERLPKLMDPENPNRRIKAPALWLATRGPETTVADVVYTPGKPIRYSDAGQNFLNKWRPPSLKVNKHSADPWTEHVAYVFREREDEVKWFFQWLAYPLQNLGAKLNQAVFMYSTTHGIGKNFIFQPFIEQIYEKDWNYIGGDALNSDYNGWIAEKRFVMVDEFYTSMRRDRAAMSSNLKRLVTSNSAYVNEKFIRARSQPNYAQLVMLSNHNDSLALEASDRRIYVLRTEEKRKPEAYYEKLGKWGRNGGSGAVLNFLMNKTSLEGFNPYADAPFNEFKKELIGFSTDDNTSLIDRMMQNPAEVFCTDEGKILSGGQLKDAGEIVTAMNQYADNNNFKRLSCGAQGMGSYLAHRGSIASREVKIRYPHTQNPKTVKLYAVLNGMEWSKKTSEEWITHYKINNPVFTQEMKNVTEFKRKEK